FSSSLKSLASNLLNLCHDLKFMSSGPKAGISEITLPAVQPGSSIMPGKVNPGVPECMEMICLQVLGNDHSIGLAAQKSQLELNVYCPLIMTNILGSMQILSNGLQMLVSYCLENIEVNQERIRELFDGSLCTATALAPILGYAQTADIVKSALTKKSTLKAEVLSRKLLSEAQINKLL
ncbi:aspartate ammonia-lyase, partial [Candidatus Peregrinibacteria bacterium]|nr:aspartate ammonia-lyase [Candidatus Peregrinibacteria bacterium]